MTPFELRTLTISDIAPAPFHPRRVPGPRSAAYRRLRDSLTAFGLVEPLVWNERSGRVVGGHARLRILAEQGVSSVPVSVVRLSDAREKALNVALNNPRLHGRFDAPALRAVLTELESAGELPPTGFDARAPGEPRLKPSAAPAPEPPSDRVEVTLVTDRATFAALGRDLDHLIGAFDVVAHVREAARD